MLRIGDISARQDGNNRDPATRGELLSLLVRARRLNAVKPALSRALASRQCDAACRPLNLGDDGELILAAPDAAQATRIRQILPTLAAALKDEGITKITVKLQKPNPRK